MSDKRRLFRLHAEVSILDYHEFYRCHTTTDMQVHETATELVARLLAFALFYRPGLKTCHKPQQRIVPAWVNQQLSDATAIFTELPEPKLLKRLRHEYAQLRLLLPSFNPLWFHQQTGLIHAQDVAVVTVAPALIEALALNLEHELHWSIVQDSDRLSVATEGALYESEFHYYHYTDEAITV